MAAPGIRVEERNTGNGPIQADDASVAGFMGVAEFGPLATPTLVRSFTEFKEKFGSYMEKSDLAYNVELFFLNGGRRCYISRLANYSDITDADSHSGVKSSLALNDQVASGTLDLEAKYFGIYGDNIEVEVVENPLVSKYTNVLQINDGDPSMTLSSKANISVGQALRVAQGRTPTSLSEAISLANYIKTLYNQHLATAGAVHAGADATNVVSAANASDLTTLIALLTELQSDYEAHRIDTPAVHSAADVTNVLTAAVPTDLDSCYEAIEDFVAIFDAHVNDAATAHGAVDSASLIASEGYVKVATVVTTFPLGVPLHVVAFDSVLSLTGATILGVGVATIDSMEFDINVYYDGDTTAVETLSRMTMESDLDNYAVDVINNDLTGSKYLTATNLASASGVGADTPVALAKTALAGGASEVGTGITYIDLIGDPSSGLGLNAFDATESLRLLCAIPEEEGSVTTFSEFNAYFISSALDYCAARADLFFIAAMDHRLNVSQMIDARNSGGFDSSYGAVYGPRVTVLDKRSGADSTTRNVSPLGAIFGKFATVDNLEGPWSVAAGGAPYGNLSNVVGVEKSYSPSERSDLNDASINVVRDRKNSGVLIYGVRTLSTNLLWRYINVRRLFTFVSNSIVGNVEDSLFRNNNAGTWNNLRRKLTRFLTSIMEDGAFASKLPSEAFFVKVGEADGVQTSADTLNGILITEIGLAPNRPGEFLVFRMSQMEDGIDVEEL